MARPRRKIFRFGSASAHAVLLNVAIEVLLVRLEVSYPLAVGEVEEVLRLRGIDARENGRLARVADRSRRKPAVSPGVVGRVELKLGEGGFGRQPSKRIEERGVDAQRHADLEPVVVDAA